MVKWLSPIQIALVVSLLMSESRSNFESLECDLVDEYGDIHHMVCGPRETIQMVFYKNCKCLSVLSNENMKFSNPFETFKMLP